MEREKLQFSKLVDPCGAHLEVCKFIMGGRERNNVLRWWGCECVTKSDMHGMDNELTGK